MVHASEVPVAGAVIASVGAVVSLFKGYDAGYKGLLSLETHWRLQKIDEKMLHLPAGHAQRPRRHRGAKQRHHCIADVFVDHAAVLFDHGCQRREVFIQQRQDLLR